jgi:hypothetical protein
MLKRINGKGFHPLGTPNKGAVYSHNTHYNSINIITINEIYFTSFIHTYIQFFNHTIRPSGALAYTLLVQITGI